MSERFCALITGSTDGIGKEAARLLYREGHCVILHGKSESKVLKTEKEIKNSVKGEGDLYRVVADFEKLNEVEKMANTVKKEFPKLNVLVNNAGVFRKKRIITTDGFESTFQINYLAHFLLVLKLLDLLVENAPSWIINVSSMVHASFYDRHNIQGEKGYDGYEAYSVSKLLNVLFTYKLHRILKDNKDVHVYAVHPGVINTKLLIEGWGPVGSPPEVGARNILSPILSDELKDKSGIYLENGIPVKSKPITYREDEQDFLWNLTIKLLEKRGFKITQGG